MKTITFTITITISDDNQIKVTKSPKEDAPKRTYKKRRGVKRVSKSDVTYTDMWGKEWPIYVTHKGREFIFRTKRNGSKKYKHYIK